MRTRIDVGADGFDRREQVTIPPLQHAERWDALEGARQALIGDLQQAKVAARYQAAPNGAAA